MPRVPRVTIGIARPLAVSGVRTTPRVPRLPTSTRTRVGGAGGVVGAGGKPPSTSKRGGGNGKKS